MNYGQLDLFGAIEERQTIAERIMQYGIKSLCDRELIEGLISPYISKKVDSRELADTILEAMDRNSAPSLDELKAIHGVSEELASGILIALELGRRKGEKRTKAITCPSEIYTAIRHDADDEQENRHGTNCVTPLFNKIWTNEEENSKLSALRDALLLGTARNDQP